MTPTMLVLTLVLLLVAIVVFVAAARSWRLFSGSLRLVHETDGLTDAEQRMRALTESALAPRPPWRVRVLLEGHTLPAVACYRVPAGYARGETEAIGYVLRAHPEAAAGYPRARWLAFPVVAAEHQERERSGAEQPA